MPHLSPPFLSVRLHLPLRLLLHFLLLLPLATKAQRVLHFTRTSGFDHGTRTVSHTMFQGIAAELGVTLDDDATGAPFSDPSTLAEYDVVVFANTSGDAILDAAQRANFEGFIANGGSVLGIHAASDTYRHSTANGSNTGAWDFYAELIGASVQGSPNHVSGTPAYAMHHIGDHASAANVPDPWTKDEEYYYWLHGYYGPDNTEVLRVEETIGPNGQVNDYDAPRPMSWYRLLPEGGRVFYTALGHAASNYTDDALFRTHVRDALAWLLEGTSAVEEERAAAIGVFPNPATELVFLTLPAERIGQELYLTDATGRVVRRVRIEGTQQTIDVRGLVPGPYVLRMAGAPGTVVLIQ